MRFGEDERCEVYSRFVVEGVEVLAFVDVDLQGAGDAGKLTRAGVGDDGDGELAFAPVHDSAGVEVRRNRIFPAGSR